MTTNRSFGITLTRGPYCVMQESQEDRADAAPAVDSSQLLRKPSPHGIPATSQGPTAWTLTQFTASMIPSHDRRYRLWRAHLIEESRERYLIDKATLAAVPFRCRLLTLAKKHGLTVTCKRLESNL